MIQSYQCRWDTSWCSSSFLRAVYLTGPFGSNHAASSARLWGQMQAAMPSSAWWVGIGVVLCCSVRQRERWRSWWAHHSLRISHTAQCMMQSSALFGNLSIRVKNRICMRNESYYSLGYVLLGHCQYFCCLPFTSVTSGMLSFLEVPNLKIGWTALKRDFCCSPASFTSSHSCQWMSVHSTSFV